MTEIYSLPTSTSLRDELDELAPGRRRDQDGTIGDRAHMQRVSDHNLDELGNTGSHSDSDKTPEVHARDADSRGPWPAGWSMMRIVLTIVARCVAGVERRLLYIIFDGWIWEASNGWKKRKYTGDDQHHEHVHFSFRYGSGAGPSNPENDTSPWGILAAYEEEQDMSPEDLDKLADKVVAKLVNYGVDDPKVADDPKNPGADDLPLKVWWSWGPSFGRVDAVGQKIDALGAAVTSMLTGMAAKSDVDEHALAAALAPLLIPALPQGGEVSGEQLQAALVGALRELAAPLAAQ